MNEINVKAKKSDMGNNTIAIWHQHSILYNVNYILNLKPMDQYYKQQKHILMHQYQTKIT